MLPEACGGAVKKTKHLLEILTGCDYNLPNYTYQELVCFFCGWLPGLSVRAITTLICISQLHLLSHPSVNQCAAKVSWSNIASLLLRLANYNHRYLLQNHFQSDLTWHLTGPFLRTYKDIFNVTRFSSDVCLYISDLYRLYNG